MSNFRRAAPARSGTALTLAVVLLGVLVVPMSLSGAAVALPGIGEDLNTSGAPLMWVVNVYNLLFAAVTLVAGSLSDVHGRRRVFVLGGVLFTAGSLASALAPHVLVLDLARAVAGTGAAGVLASSGAILATTFEGAARTRAFAALGTVVGIGVALGPTLSGWLIGGLGWRAGFLAHAVVLGVVLLGAARMPESRAPGRPRTDRAGVATFVLGLGAVITGLVQGSENGWTSPLVVDSLALGGLLLVVFAAVERRSAHPVLDLSLIRNRRFGAWCLGTLVVSGGFIGTLTFLPTYLQGACGQSAAEAGLTMLLMTVPVLVVPPIGGWLVNRGAPPSLLMAAALLLIAGGSAWLTVLRPDIGAGALAGPLIAIGTGMGVAFGITDGQAMRHVESARAGMAAGFLNTVRGAAEALVLAVFGALLAGLVRARVGSDRLAKEITAGNLPDGPRHDVLAQHLTGAWHTALWGVAGACVLGGLAVVALLSGHSAADAPAPAERRQRIPRPPTVSGRK
ncbi:MFS transporter [Streptomyces sp. AV19]|uniref:MFS transporter n=1 Tax=Streptomyces sp. AV19 TaxID=2793068 RepID=UPI0018FE2922|nr:MFS transporter [Streptomyces sp. AV19]MBH1938577.1 MFS transporter [Streptomyces sp. AV19]MDG4533607.1 MFS transporter [Streptomyces sp. AV19]